MTNTNTNIDAAAAGQVPDEVALSGRAIIRLADLLDHCHTFLDTHQTARVELADYCNSQPYAVTSHWIIDQLAWHALLLRIQLEEQASSGDDPGER